VTSPVLNFERERLDRGFSQAKIAEEVGISKSAWGRLENGESISPGNALKVATYFDLSVTELWPIDDTEAAAA
jgi:transcriptional regulator with XRE-family HTH domain